MSKRAKELVTLATSKDPPKDPPVRTPVRQNVKVKAAKKVAAQAQNVGAHSEQPRVVQVQAARTPNNEAPIPAPPSITVSSGEKVQQWLVSNLQEHNTSNEGPHKRRLFSGDGDKTHPPTHSPNKRRAVAGKGQTLVVAAEPAPVLHPVSRKNLNFCSPTSDANTVQIAANRNSTVRVSRKIFSPPKNSKGKKKGAAVSKGISTDWRKLMPSTESVRPENLSIVMEYNNDDLRPPEFFIEDTEDFDDIVPLDLSPPKGIRREQLSSPDKEQSDILNENSVELHDSDVIEATNDAGELNVTVRQEVTSPVNTPPPAHRRKMLPKESKRKRSSNPTKWQRKILSKAFNDGTEYTTSKGKQKEARVMGDPCKDTCNRCSRGLSEAEREKIFHKFWNLENINRKRDFITRHIKVKAPETCSTSPECAKSNSRRYFFTVSGEEVTVCKTMFLHTLGVVDCWIETSLKKCRNGFGLSPDKRGHHVNRPQRAAATTIESVKTHINLFPRVPSHYSRERSKREYLDTGLKSVDRMFRLYKEWAKEEGISKPASASMYRKIFNTEFNLGFFLPKKDQCETCNKWKHAAGQEERREQVQTYSEHLNNKKAVKELKGNDTKSASETRCIACFDLQKVLICPRAETSIFFYKNKLSMFNFTVFDIRLSEGHCYLWTETDGKKGPNEIGTCLFDFIEKKVDEGIKEFSFYSDSPTGQNRNRMIFSMYLVASARFKVDICHRFLESGHSYTEADSMHARIEDEAKRVQEIFTPDEWIHLIKHAKQDGKPYIVSSLKNENIHDLHYLVDRQDWTGNTRTKIYWSQMREVSVNRDHPNIISYRYNFKDIPSTIQITMKVGAMPDMASFQFPSAYTGRFPLNINKAKDLRELCKKHAIPTKYHEVFETYLNIAEAGDDDS